MELKVQFDRIDQEEMKVGCYGYNKYKKSTFLYTIYKSESICNKYKKKDEEGMKVGCYNNNNKERKKEVTEVEWYVLQISCNYKCVLPRSSRSTAGV